VDDCKPIASECDQDPSTVAGLAVQCLTIPELNVLGSVVKMVDSTRDLGVVVDSRLTIADHIASVCRAAYYQLRQIRHVVHALSMDAAATVIQAFVSSRLDYCNSVLNGITENLFQRLYSRCKTQQPN